MFVYFLFLLYVTADTPPPAYMPPDEGGPNQNDNSSTPMDTNAPSCVVPNQILGKYSCFLST